MTIDKRMTEATKSIDIARTLRLGDEGRPRPKPGLVMRGLQERDSPHNANRLSVHSGNALSAPAPHLHQKAHSCLAIPLFFNLFYGVHFINYRKSTTFDKYCH